MLTAIVLILFTAIIGGLIAKIFKLPLLLGYIGAGGISALFFPTLAKEPGFSDISDIGVTLLMFSIGIEFSFNRLFETLKKITLPATIQIIACTVVYAYLFSVFGLSYPANLYLAVAASFSSTAIVVKYLTERGSMHTQPGAITTAWLAVQDLSVVFFVLFLSSVAQFKPGDPLGSVLIHLSLSVLISVLLLGMIILMGKIGIPALFSRVAKLASRELFFLFVVLVVMGFAWIAQIFGISAPIGAFLAGLLVAETTENHAVFAQVRPLRDLFSAIFFITIGFSLPLFESISVFPLIFLLTVTVIVLKWVTVFFLTASVKIHEKTSFYVATALIPVSEFAIILNRQAVEAGFVAQHQMVLVVGMVFLSSCIGIPAMDNVQKLYYRFWPKHTPWQKRESEGLAIHNHVVILGYGRVGKYIGRALELACIPFLVVDYNRDVVTLLIKKGISVVYGDPADRDVLDYAQVDWAKMVVVAIPDRHTQELVISHVRSLNRNVHILCRTHYEEDQKYLKSLGVDTVVQPEFEAALSITQKLYQAFNISPEETGGKFSRLKIEHGLG